MGVGRPCQPVRNVIVTPRHLLYPFDHCSHFFFLLYLSLLLRYIILHLDANNSWQIIMTSRGYSYWNHSGFPYFSIIILFYLLWSEMKLKSSSLVNIVTISLGLSSNLPAANHQPVLFPVCCLSASSCFVTMSTSKSFFWSFNLKSIKAYWQCHKTNAL